MRKGFGTERFALILFLASVTCLAFAYGIGVGKYELFPYGVIAHAKRGLEEIRGIGGPWYYRRIKDQSSFRSRNSDEAYRGLNLVTRMASRNELAVSIMDMDGHMLHEWNVDWFRIWPDAEHLPAGTAPVRKPGAHVHGAAVLDDGSLVFNFEFLGLVRLDRSGQVVWRLPYPTHHTVHQHDDGNFWVCGQKHHTKATQRFPNRLPPFAEYTLLEVTPEGRVAEEWSIPELLQENGFQGLLHMGSLDNWSTGVHGDSLHLNDVEPFPATINEGFFERNDILVSLRNINTVFVFDRQTRKIKFICTGWFVRQHDPDFIDGDRFSVFDNNNIAPPSHGHQSRIVIVSARDRTREVFFEGNSKSPFYTDIMGKHQWLPNGNLLITESRKGMAFEINQDGDVVWNYINYVDREVVGLVDEVQRLPLDLGRLFSRGSGD